MGEALPRYSIIIPAHNEQDRIEPLLRDFFASFQDSELIVVVNGCTDDTEERVRLACAGRGDVRLIVLPQPVGKGGAVRAGLMVARAPAVGFIDADGSTSAAEMRRLCESLDDADGVIASRWLKDSIVRVPQTRLRRFASRTFNAIVRVLFGLRFSDTQCGAKVFRTASLRPILHRLETANFAFDVDLLLLLSQARRRVVELPTVWEDRTGSRLHVVNSSMLMLAALLRLRLRHSPFHPLVPWLDRVVPTKPLRMRDHLRILILNWRDIRHPQAGGAERYLHEIARRLVARGHSVAWLTSGFPGAARSEVIDGISITRTGNAFSVYLAVPLEYLRSCVDRFDLIIDSENGIPFFSPMFSLKAKLCVMYHVHREVFLTQLRPPLSWLLAWIETSVMPFIYRNVTFVTISENTRDAMLSLRLSRRPIFVVPSGVDPALTPGPKSPRPTIVYLGRLKPYKRIDLLLRAFARVRRRLPDARLRIAGRGEDEARLRELAGQLELGEAITFEGFVDEARKRTLLQEAWIYATASLVEGWGISVIEANACGTPAVAFDVPGLREAIVDGVSGVVVPGAGALADDLADALTAILTDTSRRDTLIRGAVERAATFSWDAAADSMLAIMSAQFVQSDAGVILNEGVWHLPKASAHAGEGTQASEHSRTTG